MFSGRSANVSLRKGYTDRIPLRRYLPNVTAASQTLWQRPISVQKARVGRRLEAVRPGGPTDCPGISLDCDVHHYFSMKPPFTQTKEAPLIFSLWVPFAGSKAPCRDSRAHRPAIVNEAGLWIEDAARSRVLDKSVCVVLEKEALGDGVRRCGFHGLYIPGMSLVTFFERETRVAVR
jgi:hypothetical protein